MLTSIYPIPSAEPRAELGTCRSLIQLLQEKKDPPPQRRLSFAGAKVELKEVRKL